MATIKKSIKNQPVNAGKQPKSLLQKYSPLFMPVGVAIAAFVAIFVFVIQPSQPDVLLKKAFKNTFDPSKINSARYNGSFGNKEEKIAVEYSGQISGEKTSSLTSINYDNARSTIEQVKTDNTYIKLTGSENFNSYVQSLSVGTQSLNKETQDTLALMDGKWVRVTRDEESLLSAGAGCNLTSSSGITAEDFNNFMLKFPFKVTSGPFHDDGDSATTKMVISLIDPEHVTAIPLYDKLQSLSECTTKLRKKDFKTRSMNTQDFASLRIEVFINQSSQTVTKMIVKQFDNYFQIIIKDLNKDVAIKAPEDSVPLVQVLPGLPNESKLQLLKSLNL